MLLPRSLAGRHRGTVKGERERQLPKFPRQRHVLQIQVRSPFCLAGQSSKVKYLIFPIFVQFHCDLMSCDRLKVIHSPLRSPPQRHPFAKPLTPSLAPTADYSQWIKIGTRVRDAPTARPTIVCLLSSPGSFSLFCVGIYLSFCVASQGGKRLGSPWSLAAASHARHLALLYALNLPLTDYPLRLFTRSCPHQEEAHRRHEWCS